MPGFPHSLGSFAVVATPLTKEDVQLQGVWGAAGAVFQYMDTDVSGTKWFLTQDAMGKYSLSSPGHTRVMGLFSPRHPIPLVGPARRLAKLPDEARTMVWSYPVAGWQDLDMSTSAVPPSVAAFLQVGGFVYMDKDCAITSIQAFMATTEADRGFMLNFGWPRPFNHEWMRTLVTQNRFEPITIKALRALGARYFCWLRPKEVLSSHQAQPHVPDGGFVYLFSDSLGVPHELDRYFPAVFGSSSEVDPSTVRVDCSLPLSYIRRPASWAVGEDEKPG